MSKLNFEKMAEWERAFEEWSGNKMLFWAGKMAHVAESVVLSNVLYVSTNVELLSMVTARYNQEVLDEMNKDKE